MHIAILGAPGCVGRKIIKQLLINSPDYEIIASYRTEEEIPKNIKHDHLIWRRVNLFDSSSAEFFLKDADILIYLIHSLESKDFEKLDVQLANAAVKAARKANLKKILYLGGIVPDNKEVSAHLLSRKKTGEALASYGIPVGEVRASILLATCSMSYRIVYFLARRLPVIIGPRWLNSLCAPIALEDTASFIKALISRNIRGHEVFEIGSDIVRYRDLIALSGRFVRGIKNFIIPVPLLPIYLYSPWLQFFTGVPKTVGMALAEGLRTDTVFSHNRFREITGRDPLPIKTVLRKLAEEMKLRKF